MEVAGLVLGAVALVQPICKTVHDTLESYQGFGKDAERLRLRFAVQQARLESFERLLFDKDKFAPVMPGRLIDHLPEKTCSDVLALLRQLYGMLLEYAAVRAQYKMQDRSDGTNGGGAGNLFDGDVADRAAMLVREGKRADAAQQRSVGWVRKAFWVAFDKSSTEKLVREFEAWADRTRVLLEAAWWPLSFFETVERMRRLETDRDARAMGLLRGIGLRKLLASPPATVFGQTRAKEIVASAFAAAVTLGAFELGTLQEGAGDGGVRYLVEYKQAGGPGNLLADVDAVRERVVQLAGLLNEAPQTDEDLRVLQCTHYFQDAKRCRFGLVFALPAWRSQDDAQLLTLAKRLGEGARARPSLSSRMRLAYRIALSLQRLHAYSWVHKSLRSENILLLPPSADRSDAPGTQEASSPASNTAASLASSLDDPRLIGFEYSRQEMAFSDRAGEFEIKRNIYRHPSRWGPPTTRFEKIHDMFALGVILLEIGLWERVDTLDRGLLVSPAMAADRMAVYNRLVKHAEERLGFYAGSKYRDIVVGCLTGTCKGGLPVTEAFPEIVETLKKVAAEL
ncbi:hypothetical protein VTK73DRAFT_188 [Phialemonium thermophilum]|uniref:Protein kinase domain-containing protein n=1 Tax=Phialemonium thermophilum TaxID=223376 RepID=A0ABR3XGJ4_9PEZI